MVPILLLSACLEKATDAPVPLDPRFYEGHEEQGNTTGVHEGGGGNGMTEPWSDVEGSKVGLEVVVTAPGDDAVQVDVGEYDPTVESRTKRVGSVQLAGPGTLTLQVPVAVTKLSLQAFQDLAGDGPDDADPFAMADVDLSAETTRAVTLALVKGARGQPSGGGGSGSPAPPGAPGGPTGGGGGRSGMETLVLPEGPRAALRGRITASRALPVILDVFSPDPQAPGGRIFRGRTVVAVGDVQLEVSRAWGSVEVEAYQDLTGDSRSNDDPVASGNRPFDVSGGDAEGLVLAIP
jgi:hypothetical protein